jgi:predicted RNase H-like nuclease (RuvC/YqgF family)
MTIQPISSAGSTASVGTAGIRQLQSQIASLERQIASEQKSSDDEKTKARKIQALQLQIQQLQAQLRLMQDKAKEQAAAKNSPDSAAGNTK